MTAPVNRWIAETGGTRGRAYEAHFSRLAAGGSDVHGEARFIDTLLPPAARVLDAGCGTGRVGRELARRGHVVVGVDLDASMVQQARRAAPSGTWVEADLLDVTAADVRAPLDAVVLAGNVVVYLTDRTEAAVLAHVAGFLRPGGLLVAGFAADRHVAVQDYRRWCGSADLREVAAHGAWDAAVPLAGAEATYAVLVHRR